MRESIVMRGALSADVRRSLTIHALQQRMNFVASAGLHRTHATLHGSAVLAERDRSKGSPDGTMTKGAGVQVAADSPLFLSCLGQTMPRELGERSLSLGSRSERSLAFSVRYSASMTVNRTGSTSGRSWTGAPSAGIDGHARLCADQL